MEGKVKKQRSCVPCAESKRSCDHGNPCGRCVRLGLDCVIAADRRTRPFVAMRKEPQSTRDEQYDSGSGSGGTPDADAVAPPAARKRARAAVESAGAASARSAPAVNHLRRGGDSAVRQALSADPETAIWTHGTAESGRKGHSLLIPGLESDDVDAGLMELLGAPDDIPNDASTSSDFAGALALMPGSARRMESIAWSPSSTLEDRILHAFGLACEQRRSVMYAFPAVPLGVPFDVLRSLANADGVVQAQALQRARGGAHGFDGMSSIEGLFEATMMLSMARSPVPSMRIVFVDPQEYDLTCQRNLMPKIAYGNRAWLYMFMLPRFIPDAYRPADGASIDGKVAAAALRLAALVGAAIPASALSGQAPLSTEMLRDWRDEQLVAAFEDGVVLCAPVSSVPRNHVAEECVEDYFRTVAQSVVLRRQYQRIRTRIQLQCALHNFQHGKDFDLSAQDTVTASPAARDVLAAHPLTNEMLQLLPRASEWTLDVDEIVHISYNSVGVLSNMSVIYQNAMLSSPPPSALGHLASYIPVRPHAAGSAVRLLPEASTSLSPTVEGVHDRFRQARASASIVYAELPQHAQGASLPSFAPPVLEPSGALVATRMHSVPYADSGIRAHADAAVLQHALSRLSPFSMADADSDGTNDAAVSMHSSSVETRGYDESGASDGERMSVHTDDRQHPSQLPPPPAPDLDQLAPWRSFSNSSWVLARGPAAVAAQE